MSLRKAPALGDTSEQISALIEVLVDTERKLEELTAGEVDTVAGRDGRTFLLRRAQEELRYSEGVKRAALSERTERRERMLNSALASMSDFAQIYDREGRIVFVNQPLLSLWGLTLEEVVGKNFFDLGYEERLAQRLHRQLAEVFETGGTITDETAYTSPAGQDGSYEYIFSPVFAADGSVDFVVGSTRDVTERKQREQGLAQLAAIVDTSADAIVSETLDGIVTSWNPAAETMFGYIAAEMIGQPLQVLIPADRPDQERLLLAGFARGEMVQHIETVRLRKDGRRFDASVTISPIRDAEGRIVGASKIVRDITERNQAAEALRTSLEEFKTLAEAMPQMVWITRPDGWNLYFSRQWMEYTGLTLEESLGHGWNKPFHPEDRSRAWDAWQHATATGATYSLDCRLRRADGAYRWWLIRGAPQRDAAGAILKWFGTCTDIHDMKSADLAIAESEQRFAKVFHSNLVAIGITEASSGRVIDANQRFTEFFGYAREEMIGRTVEELGLWADLGERQRFLADFSQTRTTPSREAAYRCKSGEIRQGLISTEALSLPGIPEALKISIVVDVTERKQLESQLLQAQKMEAVGRLAGGVAHDFNNSLGVILGYTELLIRQSDGTQRAKLEQILKATNRASGLTRQLLAFSRQQVVAPKVLDLNALLADLDQMLGRLIGEDVDLVISPGLDLGQVKADPGQLQQVVMNLCVNARDAMPRGGVIRIETANAELDAGHAARHEGMTAGRYVLLAVGDTGTGIEKRILANIFEPFFTTKETGKGTGLGLAMVYGIVRQAGGNVWVYSEVGRGTTFKIYLPRVDEPVTPELEEAPAPALGTETILLVEDDLALGEMSREILEEHGYIVIAAVGADEALATARRHPEPIHLLVTDVVMPGMNGRALAEALVAERPALKVLYVSGYTDDIIAQNGVLESGTHFLEKPFTALALLGRVREALGGGDPEKNP